MMLYAYALHYICIFTMFRAFRCVFYMFEPCMLVGLDWAEPIMFFCYCTSHARALFMHTYFFFFFYILELSVDWCFYVSLSLSLSLSRIVCAMAPKRKSIPSQNPLRSRASSSDSTPLHVRFHDEKAYKDFL